MAESNKQLTPIKVSETDQVSGSDLDNFWVLGFDKNNNKSAHATMSQLKGNMGDSAFQLWQKQPGNTGKTYEEYLAYNRQPATEAAAQANEQMSNIKKEADSVIKDAADAAKTANDAAENVQDGKTPVLASVNAQSGVTASGSFTDDGVDELGNPKYILDLTLPKGQDGQPAIFEQGTTTTLNPAEEARVEVVENGVTPEGNPKYLLNFFIPRGPAGPAGTGTGNVLVDATGLVSGKKYLFVPDSDGSTAGTFVEYAAPEIPEQVQPDWNATEGKGAILHKPGDATADASGLMSADQFQKLEKLNPSSLSNDVTGKKVEYTDDGKLLFEGKETFAVDANNELTLAGKKLSELGGGDANVINIPPDIMRLSSDSTSDAIFEIWGGQQLLLEIVKNFNKSTVYTINTIENGYMMLLYPIVEIQYEDDFNYMISVHIQMPENAIDITTEVLEGIASANVLRVGNVFNTSVGNTTADKIYLSYGGDNGLDHSDLVWNNNERFNDDTGQGRRHLAYGGLKSIILENLGDGTKALMDDGTYKAIGASSAQYLDLSPLFDAEGNPVNTVTDEFLAQVEAALVNHAGIAVIEGKATSMSILSDETTYNIIAKIFIIGNILSMELNNDIQLIIYNFRIAKADKSVLIGISVNELTNTGDGTKFKADDGTYKEVGGDYQLPSATDSALGGIKIGYVASEKNYPVQLDGSDKAYVNVPWTDTNTTYDLATTSTNGLMSSTDKTKLDKVDSYVTASSISNLDVTKKVIYVALTANGSLSANNAGAAYNGQSFSVKIYCSAARTITIPTSGNYVSMCGSSYTCPAGKRVEFHFEGINGQWWIAKLEQQ